MQSAAIKQLMHMKKLIIILVALLIVALTFVAINNIKCAFASDNADRSPCFETSSNLPSVTDVNSTLITPCGPGSGGGQGPGNHN